MLRVVFVAALLIASASADTYYWRGGNTMFNNASNWENGIVPSQANQPSMVDMNTEHSFTSFVPAGTYNVGSVLKLPRSGKLLFSGQAGSTTTIKFSSTNTGPAAKFIGGQTNVNANDFFCKSNWAFKPSASVYTAPTNVPCAGDAAIFENMQTVRVWADPKETVNLVRLESGGRVITSTADLPVHQFGQIKDQLRFVGVGTEAVCRYRTSGTGCYCFNSCPATAQERRDIEQNMRASVRRDAQVKVQELEDTITRTFEAKWSIAALGTTSGALTALLAGSRDDIMDSLESGLSHAWGIDVSAVTLTELVVDGTNLYLVVAGSVSAPKSLFKPVAGAVPDSPLTRTWNTLTGAASSGFWAGLREVVAHNIHRQLLTAQTAAMAATCSNTACSNAATALGHLIAHYANPATVFASLCPGSVCGAEADLRAAMAAATLNRAGSVMTGDALSAAVDAIVAGLVSRDLSSFTSLLSAASNAFSVANALNQAALNVRFVYTSPAGIVAGALLPSDDLYMMSNQLNNGPLAQAIIDAVSNKGVVRHVTQVDVTLALPGTPSRRRSTLNSASHLEVQLQYVAYCPTADDDNCKFFEGDDTYDVVAQAVDTAVNGYVPITVCYTITTGEWSESCLVSNAQEWASGGGKSREDVQAYLVSILECNHLGRNSDGNCYAAGDSSRAAHLASLVDLGGDGGGGSGASSSSASGSIGIIAGAAGAAVLLLIVAIVVIRRRKSSNGGARSNKASDGRTVVAFENPMYDDPAKAGGNEMYEDTTDVTAGRDEGLYDEPAFNANATVDKSNPLYESTENLAAAAAPEEGGYLDVAPENENNDDDE